MTGTYKYKHNKIPEKANNVWTLQIFGFSYDYGSAASRCFSIMLKVTFLIESSVICSCVISSKILNNQGNFSFVL